jgi:hypothetical protein
MVQNFRIEITGNLDETGDEAEVSASNSLKHYNQTKVLNKRKGSLFRFGNFEPYPYA